MRTSMLSNLGGFEVAGELRQRKLAAFLVRAFGL